MSILLSLLLSLQLVSLSDALLQSRPYQLRHQFALQSGGSDIMQRPDDEDGPEYREYLRNLMKMQANRAKSGHAAPSSGSSDAYFAKLSRLKVERLALKKAGLPEDMLDTSYTPEDYEAALFEAQEPLISSVVLTGEAAVASRTRKNNSKVRALTAEELDMEEIANLKVEELVRAQQALPPSERARVPVRATKAPIPEILEETPEINLIDQILSGRNLIASPDQENNAPAPVVSKPQRMERPAPERVAVVEKAKPVAQAVPLRPLPNVPLRPLPPTQAVPSTPAPVPVPAPKAVAREVPPPAAKAPVAAAPSGKQLQNDELELMAKTLQLLVKHRGGGPFGAGRLQSKKDISDLESSLLDTIKMLTKVDASSSTQSKAVAVPVKAAPVPTPVARAVAPAPVPVPATKAVAPVAPVPVARVVTPPPAPVAAVASAPVQQSEEGEGEPMTIAQGLNQFLLAPQLSTREELEGLRDGIIQCLHLVQTELLSRPPIEAVAEVQNSKANDAEAMERIMRINAPAMATPSNTDKTTPAGELPIEQDVKLTLGLLLKHRGGPGFGHGRLTGKELDLMASKLRSVSQRLIAESISA